jgi:hypothetical protein
MLGVVLHSPAATAACSVSPVLGTVTLPTVSVASAGTYKIWTRLRAADSTNNSVYLEVDGGNCYKVGDSNAIAANTWTWVDYKNGSTSTKTTHTFAAGNHTIKVIGTEPNVGVDRIVLVGDQDSCVPDNVRSTGHEPGDNCKPAAPTPPAPPQINSFAAAKTTVQTGQTTTLSWTTTSATSCGLKANGSPLASNLGSSSNAYTTPVLNATTTFQLTCSNSGGSTSPSSVTVTVTSAPPPPANPVINTFTADRTNITSGDKVTLSWTTSNASACVLNPGNTSLSNGGTRQLQPTASISYTLTCFNTQNTASPAKTLGITVNNQAPPAPPAPAAQAPSFNSQLSLPTIKSSTGQNVTVAGEQPVVSGKVVIDPTLVADQSKAKEIAKVEYYADSQLVQTVTKEPFALDTTLLKNGQYDILEKTYFKDGAIQERRSTVSINNGDDTLAGAKRGFIQNQKGLVIASGVSLGTIGLGAGGLFAARLLYRRRLDNIAHGLDNWKP